MDLENTRIKHKEINSLILKNNINGAFKELSGYVYNTHNGNLISEYENLKETYSNILRYSFGFAKDPERGKIFSGLKRSLIELVDDSIASILSDSTDWQSKEKSKISNFSILGEKEKAEIIDEMSTEKEFSSFLDGVGTVDSSNLEGKQKYEDSLEYVFSILWLTDNYREGEIQLAKRIMESGQIPWHDKSIIVSAITLSTSRHFDLAKVNILFDVSEKGEHEVWQRALVGLLFIILQYQDRFELYPEIKNRFKANTEPDDLGNKLEQIILQLVKSQETEKVTEKIQREIIPEVMKMRPDIEEKLKLDELLNKDNFEEKNPDWQEFFSESPDVYKKLEEFSMMQMDGSDVFMGAFSMLKRFGFFEKPSNWFLPFYKEHPEIKKSLSGINETFDWKGFFEGIEQAPVMCNSDKYSFSFNIGFMPDMQKSMMLEMFSMELKQMREISEEDNNLDSTAKNKIVFTQYIQDLYRFFKLFQEKGSFTDLFNIKIDVVGSELLKEILSTKNIRQIGEFYFKKDYFDEAKRIFTLILEKEKQFELIEKVGFCCQKLGNLDEAIQYYKKAEILEVNKVWLLKKLGYCYRKLGKFDEAIKYYKKVESLETENLEGQVMLGQLHIDKEDFETALKYYFKVEYLKPDLVKVQRPIAWCCFMLGKLEQATQYFGKVIEGGGNRSDFLNLGHCFWAQSETEKAIEYYRKAFKQSGSNYNWFSKAMSSDSEYLKKYEVEDLDVSLMIDFITLKD